MPDGNLSFPHFCGVVKGSEIQFQREEQEHAKVQKTYAQEFNREAVRLEQTSGKPIAQIGRSLGISDSSIPEWRKELVAHGSEAFPGSRHQNALEEENRSLIRELERIHQERDILKNSQRPL